MSQAEYSWSSLLVYYPDSGYHEQRNARQRSNAILWTLHTSAYQHTQFLSEFSRFILVTRHTLYIIKWHHHWRNANRWLRLCAKSSHGSSHVNGLLPSGLLQWKFHRGCFGVSLESAPIDVISVMHVNWLDNWSRFCTKIVMKLFENESFQVISTIN